MRGFLASVGSALILGLSLAGCAALGPQACQSGGQRQTAQLVFGRASNDGPGVSEADFVRFLNEEVSPRFPDGLTVIDAQGRWTPPAGTPIHEPSKMVMIVLRGKPDDRQRLDAIRDVYKRRYHQQSVLLMTHPECVSF